MRLHLLPLSKFAKIMSRYADFTCLLCLGYLSSLLICSLLICSSPLVESFLPLVELFATREIGGLHSGLQAPNFTVYLPKKCQVGCLRMLSLRRNRLRWIAFYLLDYRGEIEDNLVMMTCDLLVYCFDWAV